MLGYPVAEAAVILGVSEGTVKSRCARGRARLLPFLSHLRGGSGNRPPRTASHLREEADDRPMAPGRDGAR